MFLTRVTAIVFAASFMVGCSHHHNVSSDGFEFNEELVPNFSSEKAINVVNVNAENKDVFIAEKSIHTHYSNLHQWTDVAKLYMETGLKIRDVPVDNASEKSLTLNIVSSNVDIGMWTVRCTANLEVSTGDNKVKTFQGVSNSPGGLPRACEGAVMRAVKNSLSDAEVVSYLNK